MNSLFELADRHPLATGVTGVANSLFAFLVSWLDVAASIAGKLVVLVFFANAILTFLILRRQYRRNGEQRRQAAEQDVEPFEGEELL